MAHTQMVKLNIGGVRYRTTYSTLTSVPGSMLATYLDKWTEQEHGKIFIDRDGRHFIYILNYLRSGANVILPKDTMVLEELKHEAEFYKLPGLVQLIDKQVKMLQDSMISVACDISVDVCREQFQQSGQSISGQLVERVDAVVSSVGVNVAEQSQIHEQQDGDILEFKAETEMSYMDMECPMEQTAVSRSTASGTVFSSMHNQPVDIEIKIETVGQPDVSRPGDKGMDKPESVPIGACNSASDGVWSEQSPGVASSPLDPSDNNAEHNTQKRATKTVLAKGSQAKQGVTSRTAVVRKQSFRTGTTTRDTAAKKCSTLVGDRGLKRMHGDQAKTPSRASRRAKMSAAVGERMDSLGTGVTRKHTSALARVSAQHTNSTHKKSQSPGPGPSKTAGKRSARLKPKEPVEKPTQQTHKEDSTAPAERNADKSGKVHKCMECNLWYGKASMLKYHMKLYHTITAHQCNICAQFFAHAYAVKQHIDTVHHGAKPFKCKQCGKSFGQTSTLNTHIKSIHEGQTFVCETCGKKFPRKGSLMDHALIHSGEKPYVCEICGRGFRQAGHLAGHRRRHH